MVSIHTYNPDWPLEFQNIAAHLRQALGERALRIDHIGSTSVLGLASKECIDIQITVADLGEDLLADLLSAGFTRIHNLIFDHVPPGANPADLQWGKWLFVQRGDQPFANIHVRIQGRANQRYPLLFRDYLRCHPDTARAYAELKLRLATNLANPDTYPDVKDPVLDLIYLAAEEWASATGWVMGESDV